MNRSLNVFFGLVVCGGLIAGLLIWTKRSVSDECVFNPHDFYNSIGGSSYSTGSSSVVSGATDGGWTVPMRSSSSMFRRSGVSLYAPAYTAPNSPIALSPNGPIASSPITYTSSSAMTKSFGGGNAMGGGVSMSGGAVRSTGGSVSMSAGGGISSPISLPSREGTGVGVNSLIASSPVAITDPSAAAASYEGIGNTSGGPRGMRGKQKVGPGAGSGGGGLAGSWMEWFYRYGIQHGTDVYDEETGTHTYSFTWYQLQDAYQQYLNEFWDGMWTPTNGAPSIYEWLEWLEGGGDGGYGYEGNFYRWQPIGDVWPLLAIVLLYALVMIFRKKLGCPTDC